MITVTIRECKRDGQVWTHRARTSDEQTAINRAIRRHFGARAGFWADSGLGPDYGQIVEPAGVSSSSCVTGRVRIDTDAD